MEENYTYLKYEVGNTESLFQALLETETCVPFNVFKDHALAVLFHLQDDVEKKYRDTHSYRYCYCLAWQICKTKSRSKKYIYPLWEDMRSLLYAFLKGMQGIDAGEEIPLLSRWLRDSDVNFMNSVLDEMKECETEGTLAL
jgi:hypothetical protein